MDIRSQPPGYAFSQITRSVTRSRHESVRVVLTYSRPVRAKRPSLQCRGRETGAVCVREANLSRRVGHALLAAVLQTAPEGPIVKLRIHHAHVDRLVGPCPEYPAGGAEEHENQD